MQHENRPVSRRRLLAGAISGISLPYLVPSSAIGAAGTTVPSERITTALIGSGGRGRQIAAAGGQVVAVCDVDAEHRRRAKEELEAKQRSRGCAAYGDFRQVLARSDIDAVIVATPDHWHVPIAVAAVRCGKAVYVEKPLTLTIAEGRVLANVVHRYGAVLQVGSQQRSDAKFIRACELVRNGRIGRLRSVHVGIPTRPGSNKPWSPQPVPKQLDYPMWLGPAPWAPYHRDRCHYQFRFVSDYSGGDVTNWGAHQLDIAQWGIGADRSGPLTVEGTGRRNTTGLHDVFYDIDVRFTYSGGVQLRLQSGGNGVRFTGTEGTIYVDRSRLEAEPRSLLSSRIGPDEIHLGPAESGSHMDIWLNAIRKRDPHGVNAPAEVGHRSATVCHLANIAMQLGRKLRWDPEQERFPDDQEANRLCRRTPRQPWGV